MAKKKAKRPKDPKRLGDLLPGDRATIETEWGPIPIRVSFHAWPYTMIRPDGRGELIRAHPQDLIVGLGDLMPQSSDRVTKQEDHDDPLLKR